MIFTFKVSVRIRRISVWDGVAKLGSPIIAQDSLKIIRGMDILVETLWVKFAKNPAIYVKRVIYSIFISECEKNIFKKNNNKMISPINSDYFLYLYVLEPIPVCSMSFQSDVGFVMDVSGSVAKHWKTEQAFVKKIAERINISPNGSHAAVSIFSSEGSIWVMDNGKWIIEKNPHAELKIKFSEYTTFSNPDTPLNSFEEGIMALPYWGGMTRIDKALGLARDEMFHESNGMRPDIPKTLVFITDGVQTGCYENESEKSSSRREKCTDISPILTSFREDKIRVIVIGVGNIDKAALLNLTVVDSDFHLAEDFDVLLSNKFIKSVTICD